MTTQLLIYQTAVPVSAERHGKCFIDARQDFGFARRVNSVPLMAVEFALAAPEYAIVFSSAGGEVMPAVILGADQQQNLYLAANDHWSARYVPAFVRRYPFVFSDAQDGATFTLCVDEAYAGVNLKGEGRALFDDAGRPTDYVEDVLKFLQEYRAQHLRTQSFCRRVDALGLLEPMQAQFNLGAGETLRLGGFQVVSRERLKALPAAAVAELLASDELELIYLHLQSMRNFDGVKERLIESRAGQREPEAPSPPAV